MLEVLIVALQAREFAGERPFWLSFAASPDVGSVLSGVQAACVVFSQDLQYCVRYQALTAALHVGATLRCTAGSMVCVCQTLQCCKQLCSFCTAT